MKVKSKYQDETIELKETEKDYDFIATIENDSDNEIELHVGYCGEWEWGFYSIIVIPSNDWCGLLADNEGRFLLENIKNGDFILKTKNDY